MTNAEKLKLVFPNTLFLIQKDSRNRTVAIMISDEWLNAEYDNQEEERKIAEENMRHYRQGREDERALQKGELMQSFNPD